MKSHDAVLKDISRRLTAKWSSELAGDESAFPHAFPLGRPSKDALLKDYSSILAQTVAWQDWARTHPVTLDYENRLAQGRSVQPVPTHLRIESIDDAAAVVGDGWPERLARSRARREVLRARYPHLDDWARLLRLADRYDDVDFELLLTVTDWYLEDPARAALGVTPRQVPVPGVHAKWLQTHRAGVQALTGLEDLGLLPRHPPRIHFTYLDPEHRASGGRLHDSATVGDAGNPAYPPKIVIISENKDTAIHFPPLPGAISVEGVGRGGKTVAAFSWIRDAPLLVYWGDIDRDGLEILSGYRADLERDIDSIFMDQETYDAYEKYGTDLDQHGKPIPPGDPRPVEQLHEEEHALYRRILDPAHAGHRRIEQERIPLDAARAAVLQLASAVLLNAQG
jgi:hypothetical protein